MIAGIAAKYALPPEILDEIVNKTDGVPLFVEELTKSILESGAASRDANTRNTSGFAHGASRPALRVRRKSRRWPP